MNDRLVERRRGDLLLSTDRARIDQPAVLAMLHDSHWGGSSWMVEEILAHPDLQGLRRIALLTRDAQALYERFGFSTRMATSTYMERRHPTP